MISLFLDARCSVSAQNAYLLRLYHLLGHGLGRAGQLAILSFIVRGHCVVLEEEVAYLSALEEHVGSGYLGKVKSKRAITLSESLLLIAC